MAQNLLDFLTNPGGRKQFKEMEQQEPIDSWGVNDEDFFNSFDFEEEGGYPEWLEEYAEQEHGVLSKDWMKEQFFGTDDRTSMQSYFDQEKEFKGTMSYKAKQWGRFISDMLSL